MSYIESGKQEGAELRCGGGRGDRGYFIEPTVFAGVRDEMKVAQEEIFGPGNVDHSVRWPGRGDRTRQQDDVRPRGCGVDQGHHQGDGLANGLRAGTVWVNCYDVFDAAAPFGGFKQSGIGRELGEYGLEQYTEVKTVTMALG